MTEKTEPKLSAPATDEASQGLFARAVTPEIPARQPVVQGDDPAHKGASISTSELHRRLGL